MTPERWGDDEHIVHSGIGTSTDRLYERLHATAGAFHESGYSIRLVGHSLGAGVCALLAWLLKRDGLERVRATCFAPPACASPAIAEETKEYVNSLVMRYDAVRPTHHITCLRGHGALPGTDLCAVSVHMLCVCAPWRILPQY